MNLTSRKKMIGLIGLALLLLMGIFYLFASQNKKYNWVENYSYKDKQPYGAYIIANLLQSHFPNKKYEKICKAPNTVLLKDGVPVKNANYVFVGSRLYLDSLNAQTLLNFVATGNNAFIATKGASNFLMDSLPFSFCNSSQYYAAKSDTIVNLNFFHPDLSSNANYTYKRYIHNKATDYNWGYFNASCIPDGTVDLLGHDDDDNVNFIRVAHGKGYFYLHTQPIAFANINLLEKDKLAYASKAFSHLPEGDIYWDWYSKKPPPTPRQRRNSGGNGVGNGKDSDYQFSRSPLAYVLANPPLKWAWYLSLFFIGLYLLFRAKRQQRVIPIIEPVENTSLDFVKTIGSLYFQQSQHRKLGLQKQKQFYNYIRLHYHLPTNQEKEQLIKKIISKSQIPADKVNSIFEQFEAVQTQKSFSAEKLIALNQSVEHFYQNCK